MLSNDVKTGDLPAPSEGIEISNRDLKLLLSISILRKKNALV